MGRHTYLIGVGAALVVGAIVFFLAPPWMKPFERAVSAYDVGALVMLAIQWTLSMHRDPDVTKRFAAIEDPGRAVVSGVVMLSATIGLIAAVAILGRGEHGADVQTRVVAYAIASAAIVLGWLLIQTTYTFRYAHLYYRDLDSVPGPDAGLKFPGTTPPSDYDFAYFSFVLGMTFQVSDVEITSPAVRRVALGHALIAFAYNASIFALTVNVVASLLQTR